MSENLSQPIDITGPRIEPDQLPTILPAQTAIDGSAPLRPGDPDPAQASDGEPLFSTDPLK